MASLSELVMAAETKQAGRMAADPLQSGAKAFAGGLSKGLDKDRQLLQAVKVLEIQAKMQDIKHQVFSDKFSRDVIRRQYPGMFPEEEYREADFNDIGNADIPESSRVKTNKGIVADMVNNTGKINKNRRLPDFTLKSGTRGYSVEPKKVEKVKELSVTDEIKLNEKITKIEKQLDAWKIDPRRVRGEERTKLEEQLKRYKARLGVTNKTDSDPEYEDYLKSIGE